MFVRSQIIAPRGGLLFPAHHHVAGREPQWKWASTAGISAPGRHETCLANATTSPGQYTGFTADVTADITVPYSDAERDLVVGREWRRHLGDAAPATRLPQRSVGSYALHVELTRLGDVVAQRIDTGEHVGSTRYEDVVKVGVPLAGAARYTVADQTFSAESGLVCVSASGARWEWEAGSDTRLLTFLLPAREVRFPKGHRSIIVHRDAPAFRMLAGHLLSWSIGRDDLSPAAARSARNADLELFHGLLNDQIVDDDEFFPALVRAAMDWIDSRLPTGPGLTPRDVAAASHLSVRTLQRAFAEESTSVMSYIRERRLERARLDLSAAGLTVTEVAARWHFADSRHFIKSYKKRFGHVRGADQRKRPGLRSSPVPVSSR